MDIERKIISHPNSKTLILEILNENAVFLYRAFSNLKIWNTYEEVKSNLKRIIEAYLTIQNNLSFDYGQSKSYKEFLENEKTFCSAMDYLCKTLYERNGSSFNACLTVVWISLERKEEEFELFLKKYLEEEGSSDIGEILTAFWILYGNESEEKSGTFFKNPKI